MNKLEKGNIFLVGPMGAGKTSVGRFLAKNFLHIQAESILHYKEIGLTYELIVKIVIAPQNSRVRWYFP